MGQSHQSVGRTVGDSMGQSHQFIAKTVGGSMGQSHQFIAKTVGGSMGQSHQFIAKTVVDSIGTIPPVCWWDSRGFPSGTWYFNVDIPRGIFVGEHSTCMHMCSICCFRFTTCTPHISYPTVKISYNHCC